MPGDDSRETCATLSCHKVALLCHCLRNQSSIATNGRGELRRAAVGRRPLTLPAFIDTRLVNVIHDGGEFDMALPQTFRAMVVSETADKKFVRDIQQRELSDLPSGELIIEVKYSSLNYKDALSASGNKAVTRKYPHTPGVDAAGLVVDSTNRSFAVGD